MRTLRLQVTLREVAPRVLRVIDVPEASTLPELHELLQVAIGWTDSHLHQFDTGNTRYGVPAPGVGRRPAGRGSGAAAGPAEPVRLPVRLR